MPIRIGSESGSDAFSAIDALYNLEMEANIATIRQRQRSVRFHKSMVQWAAYWPVAVGVLVSYFAPQIREIVDPIRPWGMWVAFPMVALASRPEIHMGTKMATMLPSVLLYLQFPLEGLLARLALRNNVTVYGVMLQVLYFHVLCLLDLWLLDGGLRHVIGH